MFYVEVKWLLVVLKVLSNQVLHAYVWFSFFLRSEQWRVFSWLCWSEQGLQPWRSYRAGDRISELQLNGKLRWRNINHFFQLSSWRTWGVWTKRTARLQWNVAEPALPGIWSYLVSGLLGKQIWIWAVRRNVEGMYGLWRKSGGILVWLLGKTDCVAWILNSQLSEWVHMSCWGNFPPSLVLDFSLNQHTV